MGESKEKTQKTSFFKGLKAEAKKIIWPNRPELIKQTTAVVTVSVFLGAIIAIVDIIVKYGVNFLVK